MGLSIVYLTADPIKAEIVLSECLTHGWEVVLVDIGMSHIPKLSDGVQLTYVKMPKGKSTLTEAANRGITAAGCNCFLLNDSEADLLVNVPLLQLAAKTFPRLAAIHANRRQMGTNQVLWVPLFGSLYNYNVMRDIGGFDGTIRDISIAAQEWGQRVNNRGWSSVITLGLDKVLFKKRLDTEVFASLEEIPILDERDKTLLAPVRNYKVRAPWEGPSLKKPWAYPITVSLSNYGANVRALQLAVDLWRCQTRRPFIEIRDTGTSTIHMRDLLGLEASDVEVHLSRWRGHREYYYFHALACEHAMVDCRSPYLLLTHNDIYPISQTIIEELLSLCNMDQPVVGYEMSPRMNKSYQGMVSSVLTIMHMETMDRLRATWNPRWLRVNKPALLGESQGWPSAEVAFNVMLQSAGIKPKLIGKGQIRERHITPHFDHVTSYSTTSLYDPAYFLEAEAAMVDVLAAAEQRLAQWRLG